MAQAVWAVLANDPKMPPFPPLSPLAIQSRVGLDHSLDPRMGGVSPPYRPARVGGPAWVHQQGDIHHQRGRQDHRLVFYGELRLVSRVAPRRVRTAIAGVLGPAQTRQATLGCASPPEAGGPEELGRAAPLRTATRARTRTAEPLLVDFRPMYDDEEWTRGLESRSHPQEASLRTIHQLPLLCGQKRVR